MVMLNLVCSFILELTAIFNPIIEKVELFFTIVKILTLTIMTFFLALWFLDVVKELISDLIDCFINKNNKSDIKNKRDN